MVSFNGSSVELVPIGENRFEALAGFETPIGFRRDETGKVKWLVEYFIEEDVLVKQGMKK
jgi:hypothetical protein